MTAQNKAIATEQSEIENVLEELAGEGRVSVEPADTTAPTVTHIKTPAGEIRFRRPVDGSHNRGVDFTRYWTFGQYSLAYSVDRAPRNRTHTVVVKDKSG